MNDLFSLNPQELTRRVSTLSIPTLNKIKSQLDDAYYNAEDDQDIAEDWQYDIIKDELIKRGDQPKIGAPIRSYDNRVKLPFWLGSADKITPKEPEVLERWLKKNCANEYVYSDKLDGVSCLLVSQQGQIKLYTRGNGSIGGDVTHILPYIYVPELKENINVRGELIIPISTFESKFRDKSINGRVYKNARNMVSGLINSKTVRQGINDVHFVAYEMITENKQQHPIKQQLNHLRKIGFEVVNYSSSRKRVTMDLLIQVYEHMKDNSDYDIDGIIVQPNVSYTRNVSGNPSYMFAFKMLSAKSVFPTTVREVVWEASRWGQLKPVVMFDPVDTGDVIIKQATGHHAKYIQSNKIGPNSVIEVSRSKEVIPYIVRVVKPTTAQMPSQEWKWDNTKVNAILVNFGDDDQICIKLISNFFKKLSIKHVAELTVKKLYDFGLDNVLKIVSASVSTLEQVPTIQHTSATRIHTNIKQGIQKASVPDILGASGIFGFGVGRKRVQAIFDKIPNILQLYKTISRAQLKQKILSVEGFSDIMADKVVQNIHWGDKLVQKLFSLVPRSSRGKSKGKDKGKSKGKEEKERNLVNQKIVFSGFRNKELESQIIDRGGKVTTSVSKNTTIVIKKGNKKSSKIEKAEKLNIPILTEEQFLNKFFTN